METHRALLVVIAALLPSYLLRFSLFGIPSNVLELLITAALVTGFLSPDIRRSWVTALRTLSKPVLSSVFLFLLSAVISTTISAHVHTSLGILKGWIFLPTLYAFMVYSARVKVTSALIFSGLAVALFGLSQIGQLPRIQSVFSVPNSLALFLVPIIVIAASQKQWLPAAIMFAALLFTQSLAGVLSVLIVVAAFCALRFRALRLFRISCFVLCALAVLLFFAPKIQYLLQPGSSAHVRLQLWSISADLIREHPVLGIGLGTFEPAYQEKLHARFARPASAGQPAPLAEFVFRDPHNWILAFWLNTGLLGLISFAFLNGYVLWCAFRHSSFVIRHSTSLALITLLIFGVVDTIYWKNDLATLHWLLIALALETQFSAARAPARHAQTAD